MAWTKSRERNAAALVKKETTEGSDPTPAGGTDDILLVENANPAEVEVDMIEYRPFAASLTRQADAIGPVRQPVDLAFWLCASGSAGVEAVDGFAAIAALFQASGNKSTIVAATSITYAPATIAQLNTPSGTSPKCGPVTIWGEMGGLLHKINGTWGNMRITAGPRTGAVCRFTGFGTYAAPASGTISGFTGGSLTAPIMRGSNILSITRAGGSAYNPVLQNFAFDMGVDVQRVEDMNSATGIKAHVIIDRNPSLELTIAADADGSATLTYAQLHADMAATSLSHAVSMAVGSGAGNVITFTAATIQLQSIRKGVTNGIRTLTLRYKLYSGTPEGEWSLALT